MPTKHTKGHERSKEDRHADDVFFATEDTEIGGELTEARTRARRGGKVGAHRTETALVISKHPNSPATTEAPPDAGPDLRALRGPRSVPSVSQKDPYPRPSPQRPAQRSGPTIRDPTDPT